MGKKYINRYNSFCRSLRTLSDSCGADPEATFVLGATAQAFNLTFTRCSFLGTPGKFNVNKF